MSNKETIIAKVEESRQRMHALIDHDYDVMINRIRNEEGIEATESAALYFSSDPSLFKSEKPKEVIFGDGTIAYVNSWRKAVKAVLKDCSKHKHNELSALCDRVEGNRRKILASSPEGMNAPIMADVGIFFEGFFSTDTLLKVLREKVLDIVGYDYSEIRIRLR